MPFTYDGFLAEEIPPAVKAARLALVWKSSTATIQEKKAPPTPGPVPGTQSFEIGPRQPDKSAKRPARGQLTLHCRKLGMRQRDVWQSNNLANKSHGRRKVVRFTRRR